MAAAERRPLVLLLSRRGGFREPLHQAFELAGIVVVFAVDSETATPVFGELSRPVPASVVIDLLSVSDAAEICSMVRECKEAESIPILFIGSGQESIRSTTDALVAGGDGFFQLPVDAARIVGKVLAYLGLPLPLLPQGLIVTIDDDDRFQRTVQVGPAAAPLPVAPAAPITAQVAGVDNDGAARHPFLSAGETPTMPTSLRRTRGPTSKNPEGPVAIVDADDALAAAFFESTRVDVEASSLIEEHARHDADEATRLQGLNRQEQGTIGNAQQAPDDGDAAAAAQRTRAVEEERARERVRATQLSIERADAELADLLRLEEEQIADTERANAVAAEHRAEQALGQQVQAEPLTATMSPVDDLELRRLRIESEEARIRGLIERHLDLEDPHSDPALLEPEQRAEEARLQEFISLHEDMDAVPAPLSAANALRWQRDEAKRPVADHLEERGDAHQDIAIAASAHESAFTAAEDDESRTEGSGVAASAGDRDGTEGSALLAAAATHEQEYVEDGRLLAAEARRRQMQDDAQRSSEDLQEQRAYEEVRLREVRRRLEEAEVEARVFVEERELRLAQEAAEIEVLGLRRAEQENALLRVEQAQREQRREEERQVLDAQVRHRALVESDARADEERNARIATEEQRLNILALERQRLGAEQDQFTANMQAQEGEARLRLAELEIARRHAEAEFEQAKAAAAAAIAAEEARLQFLREASVQQDHDATVAAAEQRQRTHIEEQRLDALLKDKRDFEQRAAERHKQTATNEMLVRGRLAELEIARLRAEDDLDRLQQEAQRKEAAAAVAAAAVDEEQGRLEAQVGARSRTLADAIVVEEERLRAFVVERGSRDEAVARADANRQQRVQQEELRLADLIARAEAERRSAADDVASFEQQLAVRETEAADRMQELAREQRRVIAEAQREAEQLKLVRAEQAASRATLEDNRARARLAFTTGRFDALPLGSAVTAADVGRDARPVGDGEGVPFGGPLRSIEIEPVDAPLPPPFVALEPEQGRFDEGELPALLMSAAMLAVTGAIDIATHDGRVRRLFLEQGEPVFVSSLLAADRPEEILLRGGLITATRHAQLRAAPLTSARRMCAALADDGALKLDELFVAVRGVLTEQVLAVFESDAGTFRYVEDRVFAADRVRLSHGFMAIIAEGVRRKFDETRLWAVLGGPQTLLGPHATLNVGRALPPLSAEETLALGRLDGTRALDDVILESGLHPHVVLRAALIGVATGALRVLARGLPRSVAEIVERREQGVLIDRARVLDRLALARHGDYFTLLGVSVDASAFEVHRASQRLRERFDPARYIDVAFSDLLGAAREIVDVVGDAEAVLADPSLSEAYRRNLRSSSPLVSSLSRVQRQRG